MGRNVPAGESVPPLPRRPALVVGIRSPARPDRGGLPEPPHRAQGWLADWQSSCYARNFAWF